MPAARCWSGVGCGRRRVGCGGHASVSAILTLPSEILPGQRGLAGDADGVDLGNVCDEGEPDRRPSARD